MADDEVPEGEDDARAKFPGLHWAYTREQVGQVTGFEAKRAGTLAEQNMKQMGITWVTLEGRHSDTSQRSRASTTG